MLVLFSLANSSDTFLLLRVRELGFSSWAVVLAYAAFNVTYAAISYPRGALSDRIGLDRLCDCLRDVRRATGKFQLGCMAVDGDLWRLYGVDRWSR